MKSINLKSFFVDDLLTLRDRVNALLESRVDRERRDLEARLNRLKPFKAPGADARADAQKEKPIAAAAKKRPVKTIKKTAKKVAPKYRNPENSGETWTGRGLQPRWMRAALEGSGKSLEDFRI